MNKPLRRVSVVIGLLFVALLVNVTYAELFRYPSLSSHPNNRRERDAEFSTNRGAIMVGATAIASTEKTDQTRFPYRRVYPAGAVYAPVTGYYSYDFGRSGLEKFYNKELSGTSDSQAIQRLKNIALGRNIAGAQVTTTINADAQQAAWTALGDKKGAVVAIDYTTGAVLAYVSKPSYDPNVLATLDIKAEQKAWSELINDPNGSMKDRVARETFPPGSTFKLVTAAAAIESGMSPDTVVESPETLALPGSNSVMHNDGYCGGDKITLTKALEVSCNTAFAKVGAGLGADKLRDQAEKFGFDQSLSLTDIATAKSRFPAQLDTAQLMLSSIGQFDVAATPLQIAMVSAGIANGGVVMKPYLVDQVRNPDLTLLHQHRPEQFSTAVSADTAAKLREMMISVVRNGTGTRAQVSGVTIGGKTGTAEHAKGQKPYAWFTGFADDPHVAIAVFVQETDNPSDVVAGGRLAAPIFKKVVEALRK